MVEGMSWQPFFFFLPFDLTGIKNFAWWRYACMRTILEVGMVLCCIA